MSYNDDFMNSVALVSFLIGMANYEENLTQNDKDDIMKELDEKTNAMLSTLEQDLKEQNKILQEQNKMLIAIMEKING